ncbi:hypothetical protein [Schleiferilactobacillus perolens]|jgi:hypothetical protein|uniref:hypothetical protein n=1 Tax=Schleiferilactobacillus perolens TaxID=100468 RepID=UPI00235765B2|nr:hypothetical protein [Schleiferilactobacillus perolens]MCI2170694.1 hypothetical protein [Schleiferilactobacillus perolens]
MTVNFKDLGRVIAGGKDLAKVYTPKGQVWPTYLPVGFVLTSKGYGIGKEYTYVDLLADPMDAPNGIRFWISDYGSEFQVDIPKRSLSGDINIGHQKTTAGSVLWLATLTGKKMTIHGIQSDGLGYGSLTKITAY